MTMPSTKAKSPPSRRSDALRGTFADACLLSGAAVLTLLAFEWLFFATKPSMFSVMNWPQRIAVPIAVALPAALVTTVLALLLVLPGRALSKRPVGARTARILDVLVPSVVLALTAFLLVENFTKTIAGFNIGSFKSPIRYLYAVGFLLLVADLNRRFQRLLASDAFARFRRPAGRGFACLLAISALMAGFRYDSNPFSQGIARQSDRQLPNVLIFSSDGVNANRMSVYGYSRKTTPILESAVDQFLVSENHVTNSAVTAGSTGALLTGKLPTTTGVTQQFHVFKGRDVFEHLPGVLRQLGYHGIEIGERHYADSYDQNLRQGFHVTNSRIVDRESFGLLAWYGRLYPSERYFIDSITERIRERVAHAFGIADMPEPILAPSEQQPVWTSDELRVSALKREIERAPRPFFAQVHLLDTHGPMFRPRQPRFSAGREQTEDWEVDFLDDAILGFDSYIGEMLRYLKSIGELDSTVLIINSDHGAGWATAERLPLLIRFPHSEHSGRIIENTQRIDVAPTILSFLGVEPPDWMEGQSLLDAELDRQRLIFSSGWTISQSQSSLSLIQCQRWTQLDPDSGDLDSRTLAGHTDPCPDDELISPEESRRFIIAQLSESRHFVAPLILGGMLDRLRREDDPAERRRVARAIRDGTTVTRWLDDEMVLARAHWDRWTYSTSPAGLVVINEGEMPLTRQLVVRSGQEREFPLTFHIEDGEKLRDFTFEQPGIQTIDLAPVQPASERLFVIWSDQALRTDRRRVGVKLGASFGDRLEKLQRRADSKGRQQLAREILDSEVKSRRWSDHVLVAGAHWDSWTRGAQPAALVVRNTQRRPLMQQLTVHSGEGRETPVSFWIEDGQETREYVFKQPGKMTVDLAPVAPRSEKLFIVWTDSAWTPGSRDRRTLGIRISAARAD